MRDILTHLAKQCKIKIAINGTAYIPTLKGGALRRCLVNSALL
jgi:predicted metallopeptidase